MFKGLYTRKAAVLLALIFILTGSAAAIIYGVQYGGSGLTIEALNPFGKTSEALTSDSSHTVVSSADEASKALDESLNAVSRTVEAAISASQAANAFSGGNNMPTKLARSIAVDEEKSETLQGINSVYIKVVSENISFISTNDNTIKAHFYGSYSPIDQDYKIDLVLNKAGSNLDIEVKYKYNESGNNYRSNLKLDIYLPEKYKGKLKAVSVSGNIMGDKLAPESFICTTVSGNVNVGHLSSNKAEIVTVSGDAEINGIIDSFEFQSVSGSLSSDNLTAKSTCLTTTSGDVKAEGNPGNVKSDLMSGDLTLEYKTFSNKVRASVANGDIIIKLPQNAGFDLDFNTISGDMSCAFPINLSEDSNKKGIKGTVGEAKGSIDVETISGDLKIEK